MKILKTFIDRQDLKMIDKSLSLMAEKLQASNKTFAASELKAVQRRLRFQKEFYYAKNDKNNHK